MFIQTIYTDVHMYVDIYADTSHMYVTRSWSSSF